MRTCIGCRRRTSAVDLVRIAWSLSDGRLLVGAGHPGRGAWLCPTADCVDAAKQSRAIGRALRADIPDDVIEILLAGRINESTLPAESGGSPGGGRSPSG